MWRLKNSYSLAICQKLKTNFKKLKIFEKKTWETREEIFLTQHKKFQIKKEEDKLLITMKQSCNKKEKNRTNIYLKKGKTRKK
jgi:hypothetical protein